MFRAEGRQRAAQTQHLDQHEELEPLGEPLGKADGFIHFCRQSALDFGHNRREPVAQRPVVRLRLDGNRAVALPCTSQTPASAGQFFELRRDIDVLWTHPPADERRSFAFYRYETVLLDNLGRKAAVMAQNARVELYKWLRARY